MATRWKNIIDQSLAFIKSNRRLFLGICSVILGVLILYRVFMMTYNYGGMSTKSTWLLGTIPNLFLGFGIWLTVSDVLHKSYADWIPKDEEFYEEWKTKWRKQQKILIISSIGAFFIGYLLYSSSTYRYYSYNLAYMYLLMATVLLQSAISEICVIKFMKRQLDLLMERMTEINRKNLEAAIEIERESIEKAAKSERLKVDLISNVSHDLKTPLTSMVGYIELMKKEELDDTMSDYVEVLSDKAEKLKEMIESLFSLAKASSGNIKMHMESISLNRLIDQLFADMEDRISSSGLHFVKLLTEEDTHFISDNLHMYRICQNLLENAIKYSAQGTRVFVKTSISRLNEKERVRLEITNTAGYLMDFDKEDIIERFARADKARTSDGNGLGLAIVSTYTSALGGAFDINIDCDQFKTILSFDREEREPESKPDISPTEELLGMEEYLV